MAGAQNYMAMAEEAKKLAEKKMPKGLRAWLGGGNVDDAADALKNAATYYKLALAHKEAMEVYAHLADIQENKLEIPHEAAESLVQASVQASRIHDAASQRKFLERAVQMYVKMNRLSTAARHIKGVAEEEKKAGNAEDALKLFEQALHLYQSENSVSDENKVKLAMAEIYTEKKATYSKAIEIYESVAQAYAESNLLKFGAKDHLLNAGVLHLASGDLATASSRLEDYKMWDPSFEGSRQCQFLEGVVAAIQTADVAQFQQACADFDRISKLDTNRVRLLAEVKKSMEAGDASAALAGELGGLEEEEDDLR